MAIAKRRKKFFGVKIPIISKETYLIGYEIGDMEKRTIKFDLTRFLKGKNVMIWLDVKVREKEAFAVPKKLQIMPYFLRRIIRKGTDYVEDSFSALCKDAQIRIKPFLITRRKVSREVKKALRNKAKEELINYVKDKKIEEIFDDFLKNKAQKPLSLTLKKIYPLSFCDVRILEVEKELSEKNEK